MTDARTLLWSARVVLLDFDGPVTALMPAPLNRQAADSARAALARPGIEPAEVRETSDHLAIIRWTGAHAPDALPAVEEVCIEAELEAARTSQPTPGAHELIGALYDAGVPIVIVTNNAAVARTYAERFDLAGCIRSVVGRPAHQPELMKPNPPSVEIALQIAGVPPPEAVLIGDSVSDVVVVQTVGVRVVGYAKNPCRGRELARAGADALAETISDVAS
ncbi:HAD family hydrolase [Isoptericola sp. NPDC057559]|uniref:HAD family hydrolase n=1 Tax=Isoptericola sp. NPDC057559 TaxID=3346168 RepID=UPI003682050E